MDVSGPQVDVPVGDDTPVAGWQGMTIKDILEKVDLFNVTTLTEDDEEKEIKIKGEKKTDDYEEVNFKDGKKLVVNASNPESAFLGPKLWKNPISFNIPFGNNDPDFSIMNIDDFLNENNFDLSNINGPMPEEDFLGLGETPATKGALKTKPSMPQLGNVSPARSNGSDMDMMDVGSPCSPQERQWTKKNQLPKADNDFLYTESKRVKQEREKAENLRKRKLDIPVSFAPEDLALATIPGADFDPKRRQFSDEELRPQPIIRKRKKTYVNDDEKNNKYWERREKNNVAARRSREARRLKENQIALRTAYLEKQNYALQDALEKAEQQAKKMAEENKKLRIQLDRYENGMLSMN